MYEAYEYTSDRTTLARTKHPIFQISSIVVSANLFDSASRSRIRIEINGSRLLPSHGSTNNS